MQPLVSIIVPTYNPAKFLEECSRFKYSLTKAYFCILTAVCLGDMMRVLKSPVLTTLAWRGFIYLKV